jgi:hypothetical protein
MGYVPSRADSDVWMKKNEEFELWEYIAVYVDDLALSMKDPKAFNEKLTEKYKLKLKGVGPIHYHLGVEYTRDKDGTLAQGSGKYIDKMVDTYVQFYNDKPKEYACPLEKGDHPELDNSEFVDGEGIAQYQTMIGQLRWCVSLGRFDIFTATMSMTLLRIAPRKGHLVRLK